MQDVFVVLLLHYASLLSGQFTVFLRIPWSRESCKKVCFFSTILLYTEDRDSEQIIRTLADIDL